MARQLAVQSEQWLVDFSLGPRSLPAPADPSGRNHARWCRVLLLINHSDDTNVVLMTLLNIGPAYAQFDYFS
jgi:hypothetical protein